MLLIDGDIVCYRSAAVTENEHVNLAKWQADQTLNRIIEELEDDECRIFLSGEHNFRYEVDPSYKANRVHLPKPKHLEALREHLVLNWDATIVNGMEADDALGIEQTTNTTLVSIDKDLLQIPGRHYNFVKREIINVTTAMASYSFWYQMLVGDATDNIKGCPKVGPVKAKEALSKAPDQPFLAVLAEYIHAYHDYEVALRFLTMNGRLLWIMREPEQVWEPPLLDVEPQFISWLSTANGSLGTTTALMDQSQISGSETVSTGPST